MKCAIMQPAFLPWAGYFNLMAKADRFVFLDDVQYEKTSWQNRNRVLINGNPYWITVPAKRENLSQKILNVQIDDHSRWREKLIRLLELNYKKHPYSSDVLDMLPIIADSSIPLLADMNIRLIEYFAKRLKLSTSYVRSSNLQIEGRRSERLVRICKKLSCNEYLSPLGAKEYLTEDGDFENSGVVLSFQNYIPDVYPQLGAKEFVSHMSIVDVTANLGWEQAANYVKDGQVKSKEKMVKDGHKTISA